MKDDNEVEEELVDETKVDENKADEEAEGEKEKNNAEVVEENNNEEETRPEGKGQYSQITPALTKDQEDKEKHDAGVVVKEAEGMIPAEDTLAMTEKDAAVEEGNPVGTLPNKKRTKKKKPVQQAIVDKPVVADHEPTVSAANNEEGGELEVSKKAGT
ncbi:hypothetical protein QL285_057888 [Trifolium repens]|nr:hypothetical protein QL285_057888 [Trifolium repens]